MKIDQLHNAKVTSKNTIQTRISVENRSALPRDKLKNTIQRKVSVENQSFSKSKQETNQTIQKTISVKNWAVSNSVSEEVTSKNRCSRRTVENRSTSPILRTSQVGDTSGQKLKRQVWDTSDQKLIFQGFLQNKIEEYISKKDWKSNNKSKTKTGG